MNPYSIAYAVGYYYGRSYGPNELIDLPENDLCYSTNQGFEDGVAAGRRDYAEVDLPIVALAQDQVDPL